MFPEFLPNIPKYYYTLNPVLPSDMRERWTVSSQRDRQFSSVLFPQALTTNWCQLPQKEINPAPVLLNQY